MVGSKGRGGLVSEVPLYVFRGGMWVRACEVLMYGEESVLERRVASEGRGKPAKSGTVRNQRK